MVSSVNKQSPLERGFRNRLNLPEIGTGIVGLAIMSVRVANSKTRFRPRLYI